MILLPSDYQTGSVEFSFKNLIKINIVLVLEREREKKQSKIEKTEILLVVKRYLC